MDGIALSQPALSLAAKIQSRAAGAGIEIAASDQAEASIAERLWALVEEAGAMGIDAEAELRRLALARLERIRDAED